MKGAGSGCGYRRDPRGGRTVLHLTMIQGMKEIRSKCLTLLVSRVPGDFEQSSGDYSHTPAARTETHLRAGVGLPALDHG